MLASVVPEEPTSVRPVAVIFTPALDLSAQPKAIPQGGAVSGSDHSAPNPSELGRALPKLIPFGFILVLWVFGFSSLHLYNVTWDDALGDLFFGERYLSYFLSFDEVYLDFRGDPYPEDRRPDLGASPFRSRPWEYYPFANLLGAATSTTLFGLLGWTDPFDGFHAVNLLFAALLVWMGFAFAKRHFGLVTATLSIGFLFGSPRIVAHMMANVKDFSVLVMFSCTAWVFFRAYEQGSTRGLALVGLVLGLALATKANALFFPLIPAFMLAGAWLGKGLSGTKLSGTKGSPGAWSGDFPPAWKGRELQLTATLLGAGLCSPLVTLAVWPYLWADPIGGLGRQLGFVLSRKGSTDALSVAPPFEALLLTTPPLFLLAAAAGMGLSLAHIFRPSRWTRPLIFLWAWVFAVASRFLFPSAVNYDGVRHFLEIFPPLAVFAGFFVARLLVRITAELSSPRRAQIQAVLVLLVLLPGAWQVLRTHPFQLAYWNSWVGGYAGAYAAGKPQASDYWGLSYRDGLRWLNEFAEPDAYLAVPVVEHAVRLVAPERLRADLTLLPLTTPYAPKIPPERLAKTYELAAQAPVYVMFVERRDWMNVLMADCLRRLEPMVEWQLEGAPILSIYRLTPPPGFPERGPGPQP